MTKLSVRPRECYCERVTQPEVGRRERKKAATRKALADAALELFLERGFDEVGVKEVADAADVSVTTLFKYFPTKESLVFDQEEDREAELVDAVRNRPAGTSIPSALREELTGNWDRLTSDPRVRPFMEMVNRTPTLREHQRRAWARHEAAVASAIAAEIGAPDGDAACAAVVHFSLEAVLLAQNLGPGSLAQIFSLIEHGWETASRDTARNVTAGIQHDTAAF
jgi:AcrR family transcriptional regulator